MVTQWCSLSAGDGLRHAFRSAVIIVAVITRPNSTAEMLLSARMPEIF